MSAFDCILIVALLALFTLLWWQSRVRARELRSLAESCGFHYLGDALPRGVPIKGSQFHSMTAVWNVIDGEPRGTRIVAFDCRFGVGKGSWRRTVIAVKADIGHITASSFNQTFQIEPIDDWVFIYQSKQFSLIPRQLLSIPELRVYLETI